MRIIIFCNFNRSENTMKKIIILLFIFSATLITQAQTASDFTANDCNGNPHHLFDYLDSGEVVIISWVMPCSMCVMPSQAANTVVQEFEAMYPGKVNYFVVDDFGNTGCSSLTSWVVGNNLDHAITFSDTLILMADYGAYGMPKIIVIGPDHTVYFNQNFAAAEDVTGIRNAINQALGLSLSVSGNDEKTGLSIYPNPSSGELTVAYTLAEQTDITIDLFDNQGRKIKTLFTGTSAAGRQSMVFDTRSWNSGTYILQVHTNAGNRAARIVIP